MVAMAMSIGRAGKLRALGEPLRHGAATLAQVMAPTAQVIRVKAPKNGDG